MHYGKYVEGMMIFPVGNVRQVAISEFQYSHSRYFRKIPIRN